jgi:hypothetical protein
MPGQKDARAKRCQGKKMPGQKNDTAEKWCGRKMVRLEAPSPF